MITMIRRNIELWFKGQETRKYGFFHQITNQYDASLNYQFIGSILNFILFSLF